MQLSIYVLMVVISIVVNNSLELQKKKMILVINIVIHLMSDI